MSMRDYQLAAIATMNPSLSHADAVTNCALGLCDEVFELQELLFDENNSRRSFPLSEDLGLKITDEIGDIMWYATSICYWLQRDIEDVLDGVDISASDTSVLEMCDDAVKDHLGSMYHMICRRVGKIASIVKKFRFQGHDINSDKIDLITEHVRAIVIYIRMIASVFECTVGEICQKNIDKLSKRYPDGKFSAEASIHRKA